MVAEGVAVYIELLCSGEERRSKQLLRDLMQVSSLVAGGPSSRLGLRPEATNVSVDVNCTRERSIAWALVYFTLRSILSSLLVLRATSYWNRIPRLANLQACCRSVADLVEDVREGRHGEEGLGGCHCGATGKKGPEVPSGTPARASLAVAETH